MLIIVVIMTLAIIGLVTLVMAYREECKFMDQIIEAKCNHIAMLVEKTPSAYPSASIRRPATIRCGDGDGL